MLSPDPNHSVSAPRIARRHVRNRIKHGHLTTIFLDIDGTLYSRRGVAPALLSALFQMRRTGFSLGLCTGRSANEVSIFIRKLVDIKIIDPYALFDAGFVLEDGHVLASADQAKRRAEQLITSMDALREMSDLRQAFIEMWRLASDPELAAEGWGYLDGIDDPPVKLPSPGVGPDGTVAIWERGPFITSPEYRGQYGRIETWARTKCRQFGLEHIDLIEAGNGTLRVLERGISKSTGLRLLHPDLSTVVYIGDGPNDITVASEVKAEGGAVVAVGNAVPELKSIADHVLDQPEGWGVTEFTRQLVRQRSRSAKSLGYQLSLLDRT